MQDLYRWTSFAKTLGAKSYNLDSELQCLQTLTQSMEQQIIDSRDRIERLIMSDEITELDFQAQNSHIHLMAKILYRKRRQIVVKITNLCIKYLRIAKFRINPQNIEEIRGICCDIIEQIEKEKETPKTMTENLNFARLRKKVDLVLRELEEVPDIKMGCFRISNEIIAQI
ncbi:unnamed protein product [Blepharisma stoltei]|uniref:Uncharacterized protein n=1 Tax=Blepharisma stoltei TaxID=1481888 RepID=A0AAU9J372_9CILI|nr:unnamed protein product [Blepharisma stoltei]